jgi:hypothetical protein
VKEINKGRIGWWSASRKKCRNTVSHRIQPTSEEVKAKCLLAFISSGGVATVGWESTGAVDLACRFHDFGIREIEGAVILESRVSNSRFMKSQKECKPLDRGRLTAVDLVKGEISEFRKS